MTIEECKLTIDLIHKIRSFLHIFCSLLIPFGWLVAFSLISPRENAYIFQNYTVHSLV